MHETCLVHSCPAKRGCTGAIRRTDTQHLHGVIELVMQLPAGELQNQLTRCMLGWCACWLYCKYVRRTYEVQYVCMYPTPQPLRLRPPSLPGSRAPHRDTSAAGSLFPSRHGEDPWQYIHVLYIVSCPTRHSPRVGAILDQTQYGPILCVSNFDAYSTPRIDLVSLRVQRERGSA